MTKQQVSKVVSRSPILGLDEEKYRGQWLVINGATGRIVVHENNLEKAQKKAEGKSIDKPVYYKVPTSETHYIVIK